MTTRHDKVRAYYSAFDEWGRLDSPEGVIEFRRALDVLDTYLAPSSRVLDLGGGPGRYAVELAQRGHRIVLADISPELLEAARQKFVQLALLPLIESIDEVNAVDLSLYADGSFDAVVAFGPFYHLVSEDERKQAAREIQRVLRPNGMVFAAFIPRISGVAGLIERAANRPEQVPPEVLRSAAETGVFRNATNSGFQEGYYPLPGEFVSLFETSGFRIVDAMSLKSIACGLGEHVARLDAPLRFEVERLVTDMSRQSEVIATSGHALLVACRI
ncbi:MAG: methyltransferase domain-containing protein [Candidatus Hydrogenedentes bacterium]|nr:methyltransferase domain-containing protein [Candidatus Hydrogenedentota bacterium]